MRRVLVPILLVLAVATVAIVALFAAGRGPERSVVTEGAPAPTSTLPPATLPFSDEDPPGPRERDPVEEVPGALIVEPGADVSAVVRSAPAGATIRFRAGVYRELQIEPKDDQTFLADPGVVLDGSRVLDGFRASGGTWEIGGQTQGTPEANQSNDWGFCYEDQPTCVFPEDLFLDGALLQRVSTERDVTAGSWFFDYEGDRIVMGDDPDGRLVETSVTQWAFHGSADRVEIEGFEIVRYATPGRQGAINPRSGGRIGPAGRGWTITHNTIRNIHGWAVKAEDGMTIADNVLADNGQGGIGGVGDGMTIEHNRIEGSCTVGFECLGWEGGALKLSTSDTTIRSNVVRNNSGHGLHTDIDCVDVVIEGNLVEDNLGAGIHHEISGAALIRANVVRRNGFRPDGVLDPGILVLNSTDVVVERNLVEENALGILLRQDRRISEGLLGRVTVRDNDISMSGDARSGWTVSDRAVLFDPTTLQLDFSSNVYRLDGDMNSAFQIDDHRMGFQAWQAEGYDVNGRAVAG